MMVLISYDVSTLELPDEPDYEKWPKNARIMRREYKILFLKRIWTILRF